MGVELQEFLSDCRSYMQDYIETAINKGESSATLEMDANDGLVKIYAFTSGYIVEVCSYKNKSAKYPNLCAVIEASLPKWGEISDNLECCGDECEQVFGSHYNFMSWKEGIM